MKAGIPVAIPLTVIAITFGSSAQASSLGTLAPTVMSLLVFSASAQFAALSVMNSGGNLLTVLVTVALINARFIPMGIAIEPSLKGGRLRRALEGQAVVDAGWAASSQPDGTFDRLVLFGFFCMMIPAWVGGTFIGTLIGPVKNIHLFGLDAIFPMFFLALLIDDLREQRTYRATLMSIAIALLLTPITPPGIPVLVATLPALLALRTK